jgi:metallo-beta-lactamase family protein
MRVQFWGAARTVTGSMHLVESGGHRVLLDCGLYQGKREEAYNRNRDLPFDAKSIDAVVLSHAHADHAANLPTLVKAGFRGPIWCTPATRDLCAYTLRDSAHIQESDVSYVNRKRHKAGLPPFKPLYTDQDALDTLECFVTIGYGRGFEPVPGLHVEFRDAGHILGSAVVSVEERHGGGRTRLLFSGDVGRGGLAIVRDPQIVEGADYLIMESTYGGRRHETTDQALTALRETIQSTCFECGAKLLIPSFAMGRTQEIVYQLNRMWTAGELPPIDVYVDSPLAVNLTEVFRLHPECYDEAMLQTMRSDPDRDPLGFGRLYYIRSADQSRKLNDLKGPAIIISPSGMCEGGRILHHLSQHIGKRDTGVLFVGFQAENTLGRRIVEGESPVRIFGTEHEVRARVSSVDGYSAHADHDELRSWAGRVREAGQLRAVFLVHGEIEAMEALGAVLRQDGFGRVEYPERGKVFELEP